MGLARPEIRKDRARIIAVLFLEPREIDTAAIDSRRRSRFQATHPQVEIPKPCGQSSRGRIAGTAAGMALHADMNFPAQESSHGQDDGARATFDAAQGYNARDPIALDDEVGGFLLKHLQMRLRFEQTANGALVKLSISLRARGAYGRSLAGIQGAKLDAGLVGRERHGAAQRIDLLHEVPFADAADGRIAAHLPQSFDVVGQEQCLLEHAGSRERCLGACMAAADHDYVE